MSWRFNESEWNLIRQPVGSCIYNSVEICNDFICIYFELRSLISGLYTDTQKKKHKQCSYSTLKWPNKCILVMFINRGLFFWPFSRALTLITYLTSQKIPQNILDWEWMKSLSAQPCLLCKRRQNETHMTSAHMCRGLPTSKTVGSTFRLKF